MFAVPMYDSESGDCGAIVGYAGPFSTPEHATAFQRAYNTFYWHGDYRITAQAPVLYSHDVKCTYDTSVDGVDYSITEENNMFVVPMYESQKFGLSKIDGYAGPFPTLEQATAFQQAYNNFHNNESHVPNYYIMAQVPVHITHSIECTYRTDVNGVDYSITEENNMSQKLIPVKAGGWSQPYSKFFINDKMGVLLGRGMRWYSSEEHCHQRYSTDSTLVTAFVTGDTKAFQKAYEEIRGEDSNWVSKNFDKLTVVWVPKGLKFCIGWDTVSKSEKIEEYVEQEWIVAKEESQ